MALLQIAEPNETKATVLGKKRVVGIDLGTTNSLVAKVVSKKAQVIQNQEGQDLLPSIVHYSSSSVEVGYSAENFVVADPRNTMVSIKRLMGCAIEDVPGFSNFPYRFSSSNSAMPVIETRQGLVSPVQVSAEILRSLANRASEDLQGELDGAVITVPAYFTEPQRQATKDAAKIAGLNVYRLLNEPTAAAIAYGLDQKDESVIAVYDLGGGTFDISILRLQKGVFEVLSTGGDSALGGDDFDLLIARWVADQSMIDIDEMSDSDYRELLLLAKSLKESFSDEEKNEMLLQWKHWQGVLSRNVMNNLIDTLIDRTVIATKRSIKEAGFLMSEIDSVVMVGGSTRMPRVRSRITELFNKKPLTSIDPDRVVALGAALQANVLSGNSTDDLLLLDIIPLSLGLETMGGLMQKVIYRNTSIPVIRYQEFTTYADNQTAIAINVYQGDRDLIKDNRSLSHFTLKGIPAMRAGSAKIRVVFQVDADGLLNVSAQELSTGVKASIDVKPSYGLTDVEITKMIKDSNDNAYVDRDSRRLLEQQVEADRLIMALDLALQEDGRVFLTEQEFSHLSNQLQKLKNIRQQTDVTAIRKMIEIVSHASEVFAAKRMNEGIRKTLSGQHIEIFKEDTSA